VEITKLTDAKTYSEGIRFYRPAPYLVTSLEKDGCTRRIVYLPDPDEEYLIRVHSGLGTVDAKATLENGWNLTALGEARDSKVPETITAVGGLLAGVRATGFAPEKPAAGPCKVGFFKLIYDKKLGWDAPPEAK
jgi:nitrogen fixation protein